MLLRNKKTQGEDQNWCIILSPIQNEIDKKKVAKKLSGVFALAPEEAFDLVANTPIILLDHLTHPIAVKLKDYFRAAGAETVLTNDVFQKRKCYRTVWPEPPSLSFLHNWNPSRPNHEDHHQELPPDEALDEVRMLAREDKKPPQPSLASLSLFSRAEREQLEGEIDRWRKENRALHEELRQLKDQLERVQKENLLGLENEEEAEWSEERENDKNEARLLLSHAQEKYEALREEYANARHLYEEKMTAFLQEAEQSKRELHELTESLAALQEETRKIKLNDEQKMARNLEEVSRVQLKAKEMEEKMDILLKTKEGLEMTVNNQAEQIAYWHEKHDGMAPKLMAAEMKLEEEKILREKMEVRQKDMEKSQLRLIHEIEEKSKIFRDWEIKGRDWDKQMVELKEAYQNQEKILQSNFRQLETRECELEAARRQLRDVTAQWEEREAEQKKALLASRLVEKEALLKELVQSQEKMESEIKERGEAIRDLLSRQEAVEKEIMEARQTQRHMAESGKHDFKGRIKISAGPDSSDHD